MLYPGQTHAKTDKHSPKKACIDLLPLPLTLMTFRKSPVFCLNTTVEKSAGQCLSPQKVSILSACNALTHTTYIGARERQAVQKKGRGAGVLAITVKESNALLFLPGGLGHTAVPVGWQFRKITFYHPLVLARSLSGSPGRGIACATALLLVQGGGPRCSGGVFCSLPSRTGPMGCGYLNNAPLWGVSPTQSDP